VLHHLLLLESLPEEPDYDELVEREAESIMSRSKDSAKAVEQGPMTPLVEAISKLALPLRISDEEFRAQCKDHLEEYGKYLRDLHQHELFHARCRRVSFALRNTGRVPAEDIVLKIRFPDGFRFPAYEDELEDSLFWILRRRPNRPPPPKQHKSISDLMGPMSFAPPLASISPDIGTDKGPSKMRGPFIKPSNSTEVEYQVDKLLHNVDEIVLEPVQFRIAEEAIGCSCQLDFTIYAANLPKAAEGFLILDLQLNEEQPSESE
jgi:hypothetical protein